MDATSTSGAQSGGPLPVFHPDPANGAPSQGDDLFGQYVAWLEDNLGTTINQAGLAQASRLPVGVISSSLYDYA